ncbi:MAG: hypothetical protein R3B90_14415 [Planctomycetaceae bacterium]
MSAGVRRRRVATLADAMLKRPGTGSGLGADLEARSPKLARLEVALIVADVPLAAGKLAKVATLADPERGPRTIEQLNRGLRPV